MSAALDALVARHDQRLDDQANDIAELRADHRADHHRLRVVEASVNNMVEATKNARRSEERQYRRLELRLQILTLVVGVGAIVSPIAVVLVTR